jgi:hypothetical protein
VQAAAGASQNSSGPVHGVFEQQPEPGLVGVTAEVGRLVGDEQWQARAVSQGPRRPSQQRHGRGRLLSATEYGLARRDARRGLLLAAAHRTYTSTLRHVIPTKNLSPFACHALLWTVLTALAAG